MPCQENRPLLRNPRVPNVKKTGHLQCRPKLSLFRSPEEKRRLSNIVTAILNVLSMFVYQNEGGAKSAAREIAW